MKTETKAYLNRIGYKKTPSANYATLHDLHINHLRTVPYENLDIMREIPLSMETEAIYKKIVTRGRGGYCFELNGLFAWLLRELGFGVTEYMGRFLKDEKEIPMRRHRVLRVSCAEGEYIADVGVGLTIPQIPMPYTLGKVSEQGAERYKFEKEPFLGNVLYEWRQNDWQRLYSFTEEEQLNVDFIAPSFYCEKHPESYFRTMDMVHIFTENGRKSVADREFKAFSPAGVQVMTPASDAEYEELLLREFGIDLKK